MSHSETEPMRRPPSGTASVTKAKTWPTFARLLKAERAVAAGCHATDVLNLELSGLLKAGELGEGVHAPTLEDIGALSTAIEFLSVDVATFANDLANLRELRDEALYHVPTESN